MTEPKSREKTKKKHLSITSKPFKSIDSKKFYFVNELTRSVTVKSTLKEILKTIMLLLNTVFKPEFQIIHLLDSGTHKLESYFLNDSKRKEVKKIPFQIDEKPIRNVIKNGKTIVIPASRDIYIENPALNLSKKTPKTTLFAPLSSQGKIVGVIEFINKSGTGFFTEEDCLLIDSIKNFISIVIENHVLYEKILELSIIDYPSGLYNLKYFKQVLPIEMERSDRTLKPLSLVFFDLDFFKKVNKNHGHLVGSSVLNKIGDILKKNLRKIDIAARYGGDEFVVILPQVNEANGKIVAERLRKIISNTQFHARSDLIINITASFGIAIYPKHSTEPEILIELSDKAMYMAKKAGRNGVVVYPK